MDHRLQLNVYCPIDISQTSKIINSTQYNLHIRTNIYHIFNCADKIRNDDDGVDIDDNEKNVGSVFNNPTITYFIENLLRSR